MEAWRSPRGGDAVKLRATEIAQRLKESINVEQVRSEAAYEFSIGRLVLKKKPRVLSFVSEDALDWPRLRDTTQRGQTSPPGAV